MTERPKDWVSTTVGQSADFLTGFPFVSSTFSDSGIRLVRGSNVKRGCLDWRPDLTRFWPSDEPRLRPFKLLDGDVVIAMDGALVGRSYARIRSSDLPAYLVQRVARLRGKSVAQGLLYQWIGSDRFVQHVDSVKTHTAIPHISPRDIREFPILIPSDSREQQRVSDALADADDLVLAVEKEIAKKQAIKQGMMQELVTGRTRLPGFTRPWREASMSEVAIIDPEALTASTDPRVLIDYISLEDVERGEILDHTRLRFGLAPSRARRVIKSGDVLFGTVRPNLQSHAIYSGGLQRPIASTGFAIVRAVRERTDAQFLFHLLMSRQTDVQVERIIAGSNYPAASSGDVRRLAFSFPPLQEQRAIGSMLTDCDDDISSLKRRLMKAEAIKTGMMQQLLTGRTRLPIKEAFV